MAIPFYKKVPKAFTGGRQLLDFGSHIAAFGLVRGLVKNPSARIRFAGGCYQDMVWVSLQVISTGIRGNLRISYLPRTFIDAR